MEIAKLSRIAPEIPVSDLEEAVESYEQRLGFRVAMQMPEPEETRKKPGQESAGINRHIVGDERALRKRRSDSILASSLACDFVRCHSEA